MKLMSTPTCTRKPHQISNFDATEACGEGCGQPVQRFLDSPDTRELAKAFRLQRIQADVDPRNAYVLEGLRPMLPVRSVEQRDGCLVEPLLPSFDASPA